MGYGWGPLCEAPPLSISKCFKPGNNENIVFSLEVYTTFQTSSCPSHHRLSQQSSLGSPQCGIYHRGLGHQPSPRQPGTHSAILQLQTPSFDLSSHSLLARNHLQCQVLPTAQQSPPASCYTSLNWPKKFWQHQGHTQDDGAKLPSPNLVRSLAVAPLVWTGRMHENFCRAMSSSLGARGAGISNCPFFFQLHLLLFLIPFQVWVYSVNHVSYHRPSIGKEAAQQAECTLRVSKIEQSQAEYLFRRARIPYVLV